jgi:hypothetical protein
MNAIQEMVATFQERMEPITVAASQGLFAVDKTAENIETLRQAILTYLKARTKGHATFLVAYEPDSGNFTAVLERLQAQIRRQQWRMPTIAIPNSGAAADACFLDGWRPGTISYDVDPEQPNAKISEATKHRRDVGREFKHKLFARLLGEKAYEDNLCAKDLGRLASDPTKGVLDGKIALIHLDGNSFGNIRRAQCNSPDSRRAFDRTIQQGCREPFLRALLTHARGDAAFHTRDETNNLALRIEVLLWGGDEVTMVVPAWRGWQTLALYFQQANNLYFQDVALSHRAAIIFCHHNAPILQIRKLAEALLERTRDDIHLGFGQAMEHDPEFAHLTAEKRQQIISLRANHRLGNTVHYLSLKSFDMLGGSLEVFLRNYYTNTNYQELLIYADEFRAVREQLKIIHAHVPKGKVLDIVVALQGGQQEQFHELHRRLLASTTPDVAKALETLVENGPGRWQMIADLWDFMEEWN